MPLKYKSDFQNLISPIKIQPTIEKSLIGKLKLAIYQILSIESEIRSQQCDENFASS